MYGTSHGHAVKRLLDNDNDAATSSVPSRVPMAVNVRIVTEWLIILLWYGRR